MAAPLQDDLPLGRDVEYATTYTPSLLRSIDRAKLRTSLGAAPAPVFHGEDTWNCYEFSWLNPKGRPDVAVVKVRVPCNSAAIVESKSLKLYLNSFAQTVFATRAELLTTLNSDLSLAFRAPVIIDLLDVEQAAEPFGQLPGKSLDDLDVEVEVYHWCPDLLEVEADAVTVRQAFHTHLFRSVCPVTHQPDWASVMVQYVGHRISASGLLQYLVSYRNHAAFHETTIEQIFVDIMQRCAPEHLTVYGRFLRRGGIDINPYRSTDESAAPPIRLLRQ
ncbi:MAG TPA: NADPH-dependent 7-cyano-7-deazaguanine reductase QueF [Pseudomonadales bacterium]|nr:NADPH-dependent 7-cyano-7-deazaguanine reductase QueF [Pseudomonadales bacterium]